MIKAIDELITNAEELQCQWELERLIEIKKVLTIDDLLKYYWRFLPAINKASNYEMFVASFGTDSSWNQQVPKEIFDVLKEWLDNGNNETINS